MQLAQLDSRRDYRPVVAFVSDHVVYFWSFDPATGRVPQSCLRFGEFLRGEQIVGGKVIRDPPPALTVFHVPSGSYVIWSDPHGAMMDPVRPSGEIAPTRPGQVLAHFEVREGDRVFLGDLSSRPDEPLAFDAEGYARARGAVPSQLSSRKFTQIQAIAPLGRREAERPVCASF